MKNIILFDDDNWQAFLPLTFTRPTCELFVGMSTIADKWRLAIPKAKVSHITKDHLTAKYPINIDKNENILIRGNVIPTDRLITMIKGLKLNEALIVKDNMIAAKLDERQLDNLNSQADQDTIKGIDVTNSGSIIFALNHITDLFSRNGEVLKADFKAMTKDKTSATSSSSNTIIGKAQDLFIGEGVDMEAVTLNTKTGPIYIGNNVLIMEGALLRGPLYIGDGSIIKMGAKIYGPTSIGQECNVGGELNNVVLASYSNKSHEGYLGNAVIGEWCNLGADTNASNLKNNYENVKIWSYLTDRFEDTGLQKCGLIMGDHSKSGINTMFNTGTIVGVSCNIYGDGFPRTFIPSFSWGGASGFTTYQLDKALKAASLVLDRKKQTLDPDEEKILTFAFNEAKKYRTWEKKAES